MSDDAPPAPPPDEPPVPAAPVIAFFDVDNTLLRGASIFHIGIGAFRRGLVRGRDIAVFAWHQLRFLRVGENVRHMTTARDRALEIVGGHPVADIVALSDEIFDRALSRRLWPETVALAREHLARGHEVWLLTATPQLVAGIIAERLDVTGALGTPVEEVDGLFTGRLAGPVMHGAEKADAARALALERDAALEDCWAYSDSSNDLPLLSLVGHPVVVNPDAALAAHAAAHGWPVMRLRASSIRAARRAARRTR
ncbi:MAG: HAD-IB family hydrolase [Microbacteriaceae bacterium]